MRTLEYTVGGTSPMITAFLTLKSLGGPDPGLATATIVFDMWGSVAGVNTHIIEAGAVTLVDAATGYCVYSPEAADIQVEGDNHRGRFTVTHTDGRVQHYPSGRSYINILIRKP